MKKTILLAVALGCAMTVAHAANTSECDRNCMSSMVDLYLDANIAHDPARVPLAKGVRFTENGQHLLPGEGLWRTMSGLGKYRLVVPDTAAGRVAFLGGIIEDGAPAMLALQMKIVKHKITEVETLVQRDSKSEAGFAKIGFDWSAVIPAAERLSRPDLVRIANMYFSGMQMNDGKGDYPFADDCNRIENGTFTTNQPTPAGQTRPDPKTTTKYSGQWSCMEQFKSGLLHFVSRIRDRRYVAVDPERGLVFSFIFFDHDAGSTRTFKVPDGRTVTAGPKQPWTWELAEVFQIEHSKIHQIQAIMERAPFGMDSGWSTWEQGRSDAARYLGH
ncbi:MAG TPA: hypothetical protein VGG49_01555 [Steroidobacteraceae bacterium]